MFFQLTCIGMRCKINLALLEALVQVELAELGEAKKRRVLAVLPYFAYYTREDRL